MSQASDIDRKISADQRGLRDCWRGGLSGNRRRPPALKGGTTMHLTKAVAVSLALVASPLYAKAAIQPHPTVAAAVAAPSRSADNVKLDESRKPVEVLQ